MAALVRRRLGADGHHGGGPLDTDGRFATTLGYRFGLVLTGVTSRDELATRPAPDLVADDLAGLVELALSAG